MNKLLTLVIMLALCSPLTYAQEKQPIKRDSVKRPLLSKLRTENAQKYKEMKTSERVAVKRTTPRYRYRQCSPCDTRYVAQLLAKQETLTRSEVSNLICTYGPECRDNAEFMQMYNELVHKTIKRNPDGFFEGYESSERAQFREALDEVIMNPVQDDVEPQQVLQTIRTRVLEKRQRSTRSAKSLNEVSMLERLEVKMEADIEKKRIDRERRIRLKRN